MKFKSLVIYIITISFMLAIIIGFLHLNNKYWDSKKQTLTTDIAKLLKKAKESAKIRKQETINLIKNEIKIKTIKQLSKYIKLRKSNQPKEICDIIAEKIINLSEFNNIPHEIVVGIIEIESMWNVHAKSKVGAKGLMQVYREDGITIDQNRIYDIEYNIDTGIQILKSKLVKSKGNISLALEYYVGGDKTYHEAVYKYLGKYMLYKMNGSKDIKSKSKQKH